MTTDKLNIPEQTVLSPENWFQDIIHSIKVDELTYQTNTMEPGKRKMIDSMISNDYVEVARSTRILASRIVIPNMLREYVKILGGKIHDLKKLAFEMSDSKILVWAEISQNDENTEDSLLLAEAKINSEFSLEGFRLLTTIVEDCDELDVPQAFVEIGITKA